MAHDEPSTCSTNSPTTSTAKRRRPSVPRLNATWPAVPTAAPLSTRCARPSISTRGCRSPNSLPAHVKRLLAALSLKNRRDRTRMAPGSGG